MSETPPAIVSFAYGSNMLSARIKERCPSAQALGVAELRGYALRWHKRSRDGSGKCDIVESPTSDAKVFGVIYEIPAAEKPAIDAMEGLGNGYEERRVEVLHQGRPRSALAYVATNVERTLKPYLWYRALVVAGAREHGLPGGYIKDIEAAAAIEDTDAQRSERNLRLIRGEVAQ